MSTTLSKTTIETVKATIPFLQENGQALTQHFYKRMFAGNPEVKEFFNQANQKTGNQQQALGAAICAFAQNIETPENLAEAVSRISNKHVSLGIKPEHYPIVGEHLLGSIDDLLNPAPKEVLDAWAEAYGFLAGVLSGTEKSIYDNQQAAGWEGFTDMTVFKRVQESDTITSFYLKRADGEPLPKFKPGQYLTIRVPLLEENAKASACPFSGNSTATTMRNYSLSGSPDWDHYRISVKRETARADNTPHGYASTFLHEQVQQGGTIEVAPACGDFFLCEHTAETPVLFLSGGVGLTPVLSMLHATNSKDITFIHGAMNGKMHALADEVRELSEKNPAINTHFRYSHPTEEDKGNYHSEGFFDETFLSEFLTSETEVYFCGPKPMMIQVYKALKAFKHPVEQIHFEFFGPHNELEG